ncbi:hypothetical protein QOT17_000507 [Balamuthia mandrillaris]
MEGNQTAKQKCAAKWGLVPDGSTQPEAKQEAAFARYLAEREAAEQNADFPDPQHLRDTVASFLDLIPSAKDAAQRKSALSRYSEVVAALKEVRDAYFGGKNGNGLQGQWLPLPAPLEAVAYCAYDTQESFGGHQEHDYAETSRSTRFKIFHSTRPRTMELTMEYFFSGYGTGNDDTERSHVALSSRFFWRQKSNNEEEEEEEEEESITLWNNERTDSQHNTEQASKEEVKKVLDFFFLEEKKEGEATEATVWDYPVAVVEFLKHFVSILPERDLKEQIREDETFAEYDAEIEAERSGSDKTKEEGAPEKRRRVA